MEDSDERVIAESLVAFLGALEAASKELEATLRLQRMFQGRPSNKARNQSLLEGSHAAKNQGMTKRSFEKQWFREWHGHEPTDQEVQTVERRLNRLLKNP
jgi:hypothetical protein